MTLHRAAAPLRWPLRTKGQALRVGLLIPPNDGEVRRLVDALVAAFPAGRCDWIALAWPGDTDPEIAAPAGDAHRDAPAPISARFEAGAAHRDAPALMSAPFEPGASLPMIVRLLPRSPEAAARSVAFLDLDVLIDLAGVDGPSGALLALRPARTLWAIERPTATAVEAPVERLFRDQPSSIDEPVIAARVDRVFRDHPSCVDDLTAAIDRLSGDIDKLPTCASTASDLSSRWEEAVRAHHDGKWSAATAGYQWILEQQPAYASAHYLLGILERDRGASGAALSEFRVAVASAPDFVAARVALAHLMLECGDAAAAAQVAEAGLALNADSTALWRVAGQAALKAGNAAAALHAFGEALKREPADGETHYNRGVAWQTMRNPAEASRAYQRALALRPDLHAADFNLGVIFDQQGHAQAAIAAFSRVLAAAPRHAAAYKALAETLLASGRIDAWFANFDRFEKNCPDHLALAALALEVCAYRTDHAKLAHYLDGLRRERFTAGEPDDVLDGLQQLLYLLLFFDVEPEFVGAIARTHDALARKLYGEPLPRRAPRRPGKLRIGYLSGDFRNHVMGKMMWEALRHHDRRRFDVFGYATSDVRDTWTDRYAGIFERLEPIGGLSDDVAVRRIAADDLDALIDLSTHTKGSRPGILARKPARVQITHVASAGTLAMSAIDFKLTDRYADPDHYPAAQIEAPLVMAGCVYPYRHVPPAPANLCTREALGIAHDAVVIGAFCAPIKLSQRCLALWRDVLTQAPNALLAFSPLHPSLREVFARTAAAAGIDARRIRFVPQGRDDAENQARYRLIDFVLDPLPYGGVNGTLEALDMGVPVVTLVGSRHAERTSYSILSNLGVTDTIAQTGVDYVRIAARLATDRPFMSRLRARIGEALLNSALTDMPAHARNLEQAYVDALRQRAPEVLSDAERRLTADD